MKNIKNVFISLLIASSFVSCNKDNLLDTPAVTAAYKISIPSYAYFNGAMNYNIDNKTEADGTRPFDAIANDYCYETWVKYSSKTQVNDTVTDGSILKSSVIMSQSGVFMIELTPPNKEKAATERVIPVVDYNQASGVGEKTILVESEFDFNFTKLSSDNKELKTMTTFDKEGFGFIFDEWIHIAINRSSTTGITSFYINGKLVEQSSDPLWVANTSKKELYLGVSRLGRYRGFSTAGFKGFRISNTERYPSEFVPELYPDLVDDSETFFMLNMNESEELGLDYRLRTTMEAKGTYSELENNESRFKQTFEDWTEEGSVVLTE